MIYKMIFTIFNKYQNTINQYQYNEIFETTQNHNLIKNNFIYKIYNLTKKIKPLTLKKN